MIYELTPRFDSRQSFYKKAMVEDSFSEDKVLTKTLYSYGTNVATFIDKDCDHLTLCFNEKSNYSATTRRHVWDFVRQLAIPGFMAMYESLKFKSFAEFLRKVDRLCYNGERNAILLVKGTDSIVWNLK